MYAIIDVETDGGNMRNGKITEVAIYIHNGIEVVNSFTTLVNSETNIPYFITRLTGINNDMIRDAPKFYEIAKDIVKITEGMTFVAHNSAFDYGMIKSEFKQLGFSYKRNTLCTVKLSRKLLPGQDSYSLGNLCESLGINIENRHRASGDALATVKLFELLLALDQKKLTFGRVRKEVNHAYQNPNISDKLIQSLPEETGVYYFYNSDDELIYIGKSKNIRKRVVSHLMNSNGTKAMSMKNDIHDIDFEVTGSELVALLKESEEIKQKQPYYNRAQKRTYFQYGLFTDQQIDGYIRLEIRKIKEASIPITAYSGKKDATEHMYRLNEQFNLCLGLTGLHKSGGPCFNHKIKLCNGACNGSENATDYNMRVMEAIESLKFKMQSVVIVDKGRTLSERSVIQLKNGRYIGYGFAGFEHVNGGAGSLMNCVEPFQNNRDVHHIINSYLKKNEVENLIDY